MRLGIHALSGGILMRGPVTGRPLAGHVISAFAMD